MPEEPQAPVTEEVKDTPTEAAPTTEVGTPASSEETNFEKRYNDLRPEFDRTKQTLSQKEQEAEAWRVLATSDDPDDLQQAADLLGVELEQDEETPDEFADPNEQKFAHTEKQLKELTEWQQNQEARQIADAIRSHVADLSEKAGITLTDKQKNAIFRDAVDYGANPEATAQAFKEWQDELESFLNEDRKNRPKSKRAPHITPGGQSAEQVPDLDDPEARRDYIRQAAKQIVDDE